jgi:hypothetical protein
MSQQQARVENTPRQVAVIAVRRSREEVERWLFVEKTHRRAYDYEKRGAPFTVAVYLMDVIEEQTN